MATSPQPSTEALGKYYLSDDYISHSNKAKTLFDQIYRVSRNFSLNWKIRLVRQYVGTTAMPTLLDYGCGTGEFLDRAKQAGFNIYGLEPSARARAQAQILTGQPIAEALHSINNTFDAITLWHVLEHVPNLEAVIETLRSHLRKNGTMFIAVPNHQSNDAKKYKELWAGYDVPRHLWHFSQQTMNLLLQKHQFKVEAIVPMKLDSYYVSMLSEKYKRKGNTITGLTSAFFTGLNSNLKASSSSEYSSLIYVAKKC